MYSLYPGEYVASGSDDGRWFIWEKKTGRLLKMLQGDDAGKNHLTFKINQKLRSLLTYL